ncbi:autophagy protein atg9 [Neophaeococcomyces mojaviensis]|uniref:Autophagy protein atg9 n=1 Tax=Neophaeococcomyces mojaviensis TaxID=3383035 RepID=A0ACC3ACQ2_9EURO|nr:autophagy protein atg9 [Knufia sp. JES_112]
MALLARFRSDPVAASIYETIKDHEEDARSDDDDFAEHPYHDRPSTERVPRVPATIPRTSRMSENAVRTAGRPGKSRRGHTPLEAEDLEDDVPASLLIEGHAGRVPESPEQGPRDRFEHHQMHPEWDPTSPFATRMASQNLPQPTRPVIGMNTMATVDPKEKALWRWANIENLDNFLADVYDYYILKGFWSIVLKRFLNLLTVTFVIGFSLFLTQCIDYGSVKGSTKISEILIPRCTARMGFVPNLTLWLTTFICIIRTFQYILDIRRLNRLHDFFLHLLNIPESEIQSISWQEVVSRLMALRDANPNIRTSQNPQSRRFMGTQSKQRMDAHDIANRLMRKDNYMIAMINKEVLDTSLTLPLLGSRQFFTRTLEWHLNYCIMDYVFNSQGQLRQLFLKDTHRKALSEGLRRRFIFAGTTSLLSAPLLIIYFVVQNFFQHFNEYQKDPAQIGSRQYNVYAQWKFREFNELWHLFGRRLKMSHPFATRYINQFPKDKTVQAARFVTFISGALVSILGLATILDQENFLGFEITSGRTTIFYLGVFGSIWAVARGMLPDDNMIYDSSYSMEEVIEFTHYRPAHWEGRLHTVEVKSEFEQLYQMQIVVLLEEILSMIFTPFVLWISLPKCSDRIIDFFREFTVHVDGLGYVCSFAEFNFKKPGQIGTGGNAGTRAANAADVAAAARDDYFASKDNKLEQSYWGFMNDYTQNPKTDVRYAYARNRRKPFNMPPPFPGLLSPTGEAPQSNHPQPNQTSRVHESLLLDPHHLPQGDGASIAFASPQSMRPRRAGTKSRVLPGLGDTMMNMTLKEEVEEDAADQDRQADVADVTPEADLGSWKYDDDLDGESDEEEDPRVLAQGGGVLGLIRQFQKAHDDDKRGGAGV